MSAMKREDLDEVSDARLLNAIRRWLAADESPSFSNEALSMLRACVQREPEPEE